MSRRDLKDSPALSFFDFVWGLEEKAKADRVPVGTADTVEAETLRFHSSTSMSYPSRQMERVWWDKDKSGRDRCHVQVSFFGLTGVNSPLPQSYLREILDDEDSGLEPRVTRFFDIFNHRLISLYYRAWLKYRGHMSLNGGDSGGVGPLLLALGGVDSELRGRGAQHADPRSFLPLLAPLTRRVKTPFTTECSLRELLGIPVEVVSYDLRQVPVPVEQQLQLGLSACALDSDDPPVLGEFVPDYMGRCEIRLGPMPKVKLDALKSGGALRDRIHDVLSRSLPTTMEYRLTLLIEEDEVDAWSLSKEGGPQLGQDMWLGAPRGADLELPFSVQEATTIIHA